MVVDRTREKINFDEAPKNTSFSVKNMDRSADPFKDFYRFANGLWIDNNPIPEDKSRWGAFNELEDSNIYKLGKILEECAFSKREKSSIEKMVGDFYLSVLDREKMENVKFNPIKNLMELIDETKNKEDMAKVVHLLHSHGISALFAPYSMADEKNSSIYSFYIYQGGLSLPDRDYYLSDNFAEIKGDYFKHIKKMFAMYGFEEDQAETHANSVLKIENEIATINRPQADLRDTEKNYNRINRDELNSRFEILNLNRYLELAEVPKSEYIVVGQPEVIEGIGKILGKYPIEEIKSYLKWNVLHFAAPYLHEEAEMESFDFFNRKLMGQAEPEKRWKKAVKIVDRSIGEALGQLYVEREFGQDARERMETMVNDIREVFAERLKNLSWMTEETKQKALEKFSKFRPKIGFPSKWIDYSPIKVDPEDLVGNVMRSEIFEFHRSTSRVNEKVDRELWYMTPPTVNAYFSPTENEIVFPAGILQPPFFDKDMDDAVNYGGIGGVISHEITHGFDDQGRTFDADGNIRDWWTEKDADNFKEKAQRVVEQYEADEVLPKLHVNGKLTLGENIADLGGVTIAFEALQRRLAKEPAMRKRVDGFTPEQRFFLSWAQIWKGNAREQEIRRRIAIDPHSPSNFRGSIPPKNHEKFEENFKEFSKLQKTDIEKILIW